MLGQRGREFKGPEGEFSGCEGATGVRSTIDLIGSVPLEFNIAAPISTGTDDEEQVFSFQIGSLF